MASDRNRAPGDKMQFASDNYAGICPEAWEAMAKANAGYAGSYGEDAWTKKAVALMREIFETDCEVFFVFNGTSANSLALASICQPYHAILCHKTAHIESDECGAPGFFTDGSKLILLNGESGKISPAEVKAAVEFRSDVHYVKPRALSITQTTELGTVYSSDQILSLCTTAREFGLHVHMDGARFANAVAATQAVPKDLTWKAGVDVLSFGGTKNGLGIGEAIIFFNHDLANEFEYRRKQAGQLASKMRYLSAPWVGILEGGAWLTHAAHANYMASILEAELKVISGLEIMFPREANAVFVQMPEYVSEGLHDRGWHFYTLLGQGDARLMCSWATNREDIEAFIKDIRDVIR